MTDDLHHELRQNGTVRFYVRARPGAAETRMLEVMDDGSLKVAVTAPPEGGRANAALTVFLAGEFGVPRSQVTVVSGRTARLKLMEVRR